MDKRKEKLYQYIFKATKKNLQSSNNIKELGCDALNISLDMRMERSNVSRLLNQLHKEGRVIKTQGRPTLYMCRAVLENCDPNSYIPNVIPKGKSVLDFIHINTISSSSLAFDQDCFRLYNANQRTNSMFEPIKDAKSALLYPPSGLNILLYGDACVGKLKFAKALFDYGIQKELFFQKTALTVFDCMNYENYSTKEILGLLYGSYDGTHLKKGIFEQTRNGVLIFNHLNSLSSSTLTHIYNAIYNKSYTPINLTNKEYPLNCLLIGISSSDSLSKTPDIRRCFPMQIRIPSLKEKSIQEMLVLTMQYLQEESHKINKTIRISKGSLSCFVMSDYSGNLPHLHAEIKHSCAHAFCKYLQEEALFVNIDYDDISTPVLTDIFDVNERMNELDSILNIFDNEFFFFTPLQQNRELELLYDLHDNEINNDTYLNNIEDKLINLCIQDINAAVNIHLNTIRSIMLKQVYDTVYPILQDTPICANENLLYGLLLHISDIINKTKSGNTISSFTPGEYKIAKEEDFLHAKEIYTSVKHNYDLSLPTEEVDYIATYLYLSSQWIDNNYIQLLIISENSSTAKDYADYLNSLNYKTIIHWFKLDSNLSPLENSQLISVEVNKINKDKGVVIATDSKLVESYETQLKSTCAIEFVLLPNISIKMLVTIVEKIVSLGVTIRSIKNLNSSDNSKTTIDSFKESHAQELLHNISEKVLSESLVFLNPNKACQALFNVLINILHDLKLNYSDDLLIKFIFHCGFVIERCIRKEPMTYSKARTIINQHDSLYYVVEKNFEIVTEILNVTFPPSEIAMIMEIFLPSLDA